MSAVASLASAGLPPVSLFPVSLIIIFKSRQLTTGQSFATLAVRKAMEDVVLYLVHHVQERRRVGGGLRIMSPGILPIPLHLTIWYFLKIKQGY